LQPADSIKEIIDHEATELMQATAAVGLAIGIYQQGKTYTYSYGTRDKAGKSPISSESIFNIASLSKTFTGQLLAIAVSEHKLSLDDDIRKYLDESYPNLEYNGKPIKLVHLVSHVSRIPFQLSNEGDIPEYTRADFYRDLHNIKIDTIPGVRFMYSNAAVQLLGYILENVYQLSYDDLLAKKICRPLVMEHTMITPSGKDVRLLTKGYTETGVIDSRSYNYLQGAGGIRSTVDDLLKYISFQITESDDATRLSHSEVWGFDMGNGSYYSFGLGWQVVTEKKGNRRISQDGNLPNYSSAILFSPEQKTGIVVLSNSFMIDQVGEVTNTIFNSLLAQ
jgi:CubicO group peptidase (beta-lactamase class C family)